MSCVWNIKCDEHLSSTTRCSVWNMTSSDCACIAPPLMCGIWHQVCILAVPCSVKSAVCDQAGASRRRWRSLTGKIGSFIHAPAWCHQPLVAPPFPPPPWQHPCHLPFCNTRHKLDPPNLSFKQTNTNAVTHIQTRSKMDCTNTIWFWGRTNNPMNKYHCHQIHFWNVFFCISFHLKFYIFCAFRERVRQRPIQRWPSG